MLQSPFRRVALLPHPNIPASQALARDLVAVVEAAGCEAWLVEDWDKLATEGCACQLLVTLGGDGSILRAARATLAGPAGGPRRTPPILSIDFGTLGFLNELPPASAAEGLSALLRGGEHWIETRRMLRAELQRGDEVITEVIALNDVVLARGDGPNAIRLRLQVDGVECARYTADALIVATPTGSTAYALGAGGPIIAPEMQAMLAIPVAPHLAVERGFLFPGHCRLTLTGESSRLKVVTIDGQIILPYETGDLLHVTQSDSVAQFVRLGPKDYFFRTLQEKLRR